MSFSSENIINRFLESLASEVRFSVPIFRIWVRVPAGQKDGPATGVDPGLNVLAGISNEPRSREVDVESFLCFEKHPDFRLAAIAIDFKLGNLSRESFVWVMGAEIEAI